METRCLFVHKLQPGQVVRGRVSRLEDYGAFVAFGPGLGTSEWARDIYALVSELELPAVWDADALNLLAESPRQRDDWILTPHPGEAGRLLAVSNRPPPDGSWHERSVVLEKVRESSWDGY